MTINHFTDKELLSISANTADRIERFITAPKIDKKELRKLSHNIWNEMGREPNLIGEMILQKALEQMRTDYKSV